MPVKDMPIAKLKAGPKDDLEDGEFLVYPSTFTRTPDAYGDVVAKGAFLDSLSEWKDSGNVLPGYYMHRLDDPDFNVAGATDMGEDEHGWWVKGKFDLDNPKARTVYGQVKGRRLTQLSFAFDVLDAGPVELDGGQKANELRKLAVYEFSFVPIGANQDTSVVAVKQATDAALSRTRKDDSALSADNLSRLREVHAAIGEVITAATGDGEDEDEKADDAHEVKGAIGAGTGPSSTSDEAWDGPGNEANLSNDAGAATYKKAFAWVDPDGDPDKKSSYKFIHHFVSEDGTVGAASTKACVTGIGVLNGGRGGSNVPDADRQGVYNHLSKHLTDAGQEPAELKTSPEDGDDQRKAGATQEAGQPDPDAANEPSREAGSSAEQPEGARSAQVDTAWMDAMALTTGRNP